MRMLNLGEGCRNLIFSIIVIIATLGACELALRGLVRPSPSSYGTIFGRELPPYRTILDSGLDKDINDRALNAGKNNPNGLTHGDIQGMIREDDVLGYTNAENMTSKLGWSHSNNIGANSSLPTFPSAPPGKKRILIFGESFGRGSGVPQEMSWSAQWRNRSPDLDIVNLAVGGYSMAMAYKRFEIIKNQLDFDVVTFMFVPDCDTWRDINTMRYLAEGWWSFTIMPRYKITGGELEWIPGPYHPGSDIYKYDFEHMTLKVQEHLMHYDAFYIPQLYESVPVLGHLVTYKLFARLMGERLRNSLLASQMRPDSEGMDVERHIFLAANNLTHSRKKRFILILLPGPNFLDDIRRGQDSPKIRSWNELVGSFSQMGIQTINLLPGMLHEKEAPDRGADRSHYGPKSNLVIARLVEEKFRELAAQ